MSRIEHTVDTSLERASRANPTKYAVVGESDSYTYSELTTSVRQVANHLKDLGVSKGDRVVLVSDLTPEYVITWFSCIYLGAIPAPTHTRESEDSMVSMSEKISPSLILYEQKYKQEANTISNKTQTRTEQIDWNGGNGTLENSNTNYGGVTNVENDPSDPACIFFTSGTTGEPQPYVHSHHNLVELSHLGFIMLGANRTDSNLNVFSPSFTAFLNMTVPYMIVGGTVHTMSKWGPAKTADRIEDSGITSLTMTPTHFEKFLSQVDTEQRHLSSLRKVICGGEPASEELLTKIKDQICEDVYFAYGSTEALSSSVLLSEERTPENRDSVGKALPNTDIRAVEPGENDETAELERGEIGEIAVHSPLITDGVWDGDGIKRPDKLTESGWLFTGDLGRVDQDGFVYIEGRVDNMIISGGVNVYPENVESVIKSGTDVDNCVVIGVPDEEWGKALKAVIILSENTSQKEVTEWCESTDSLSDYQKPKRFEFVDSLPRTDSGKIDRSEIERRHSH
jgi:fatty-acyl-CoA synthase